MMLAMLVCLGGCMPHGPATGVGAGPADMHNSRDSLDWEGVYEGVLPCADCPGIKTRLTLQRDGSFELTTQYLERQVAPQGAHGQFTWNAAGSAITLDAAGAGPQYQVSEGRLIQLEMDGSVPAPSTHNRVLMKVPAK